MLIVKEACLTDSDIDESILKVIAAKCPMDMRDATDETRSYHIDYIKAVLDKEKIDTAFFDELQSRDIMYVSFEVGEFELDELAY